MTTIPFLVSNENNHNIGVIRIKTDTGKAYEIRSALAKSRNLKKLLIGEIGADDVSFTETDIEVKGNYGTGNPVKVTIQIKEIYKDLADSEDEITLEETWIY